MRNTCRLTSLLVAQGKCIYASTAEQCMLCNVTPHTCPREEVRARNILQLRLVSVEVAEQWDQQSSAGGCSCRDCLWSLWLASQANSYGTSHWGTGTTYRATYSKQHFVMATVQLLGYEIPSLYSLSDHRHHWLLYIGIHVLSHLAFYLISLLISSWRLPTHWRYVPGPKEVLKLKHCYV